MITQLRNSCASRWSAGLIAMSMFGMVISTTLPALADDTSAPATTTPAADTTGTPAATPAASPAAPPAIAVPLSAIKTILLFPVVNKAGDAYSTGASQLGTSTKLKLNSAGLGRFVVTSYEPYMPAIQRALNVEDTLSQAELTPPFNDPDRARKIAQVVGTDGFALVSLDSETIDNSAGTVKMAATLLLYATAYGDPIRTYPVTGSSAKVTSSEDMVTVEQRAIAATSSNLVRALTKDASGSAGNTAPPAVIGSAGSTSKNGAGSILMVLLAGLMVGVLLNASHTSHGSSTGNTVSTGQPGGDQLNSGSTSGGGSSSGPPGSPSIP